MNKLKNILLLSLIGAFLISATGWSGLPKKIQGIIFGGNVVIGDTLGIDTGSLYTTYGNILKIDSVADGRLIFNSSSTADITDSAYILQSISDTATQLRSELADSTLWMVGDIGATADYVKLIEINHTLVLGDEDKVSALSTAEITGPLMLVPVTGGTEASTTLDLQSGNVWVFTTTTTADDTIVGFDNAQAGYIITLTNTDANSVHLSPYAFANTSSQTLSTDSGAVVTLTQYDVAQFLCVSTTEFRQIGSVVDNQ